MAEQEPRYQAVIDWIISEIENGHLKPNDRMPSEKELCEKFGLSRQTIRHATGVLEKRRIITRVRGSGTYVGASRLAERRPKTMNVAVMMTFAYSYIFAPVLIGISSVLEEHGYSAQVYFTDNSKRKEEKILKNLLETDNIDALLVEPSKSALPNTNRRYYEELKARSIPILFVNASYRDFDAPCISLDDTSVAESAVDLIAGAGHVHIGGLFHAEDAQGQERYLGYVRAIEKHGLPLEEEHVLWLDTTAVSDLKPMIDYILERLKGCTAVLTYNDEVAAQLISACRERDVRLPEKLSIVSIDDAEVAGTTSPKITTFPHPKDILGRRAALTILKMIEDPFFDGNYHFEPLPIIRESLYNLNRKRVALEKDFDLKPKRSTGEKNS